MGEVLSVIHVRLSIVGGSAVLTRNFINDVGSEVKRGPVVFVLVSKSRRVVPDELVTLMKGILSLWFIEDSQLGS